MKYHLPGRKAYDYPGVSLSLRVLHVYRGTQNCHYLFTTYSRPGARNLQQQLRRGLHMDMALSVLGLVLAFAVGRWFIQAHERHLASRRADAAGKPPKHVVVK